MSFVAPAALLLFLPLAGLLVLLRFGQTGGVSRLPGLWHETVSPALRVFVAVRSNLSGAGVPVLCFVGAAVVIIALARPGIDAEDSEKYSTFAGRVVIMDVGSNMSRHRSFLDALHRADPNIATAVMAVSGDAYRIVPFSTDMTQIDRYVRVLNADMMPKPGHNPHLALAQAERALDAAGYLVRQIVLVTARPAPERVVEIPADRSRRFVVELAAQNAWADWGAAQEAEVVTEDAVLRLTSDLRREAVATARAELPSTRTEFTTWLIGLAALLWLLMFRRKAA